jgi:hypothetical protein
LGVFVGEWIRCFDVVEEEGIPWEVLIAWREEQELSGSEL